MLLWYPALDESQIILRDSGSQKLYSPDTVGPGLIELTVEPLVGLVSAEVLAGSGPTTPSRRPKYQLTTTTTTVYFIDTNILLDVVQGRPTPRKLYNTSSSVFYTHSVGKELARFNPDPCLFSHFTLIRTPSANYTRLEPLFREFYAVNVAGRSRVGKYPEQPKVFPNDIDDLYLNHRAVFDTKNNDFFVFAEALLAARQLAADNEMLGCALCS
ncbi:hypothetical protein HDV00_008227 [Rhizophlyctis rosea]|nr:hypothetical protein HDV00_008227 [Rhizophlyctis rosea]